MIDTQQEDHQTSPIGKNKTFMSKGWKHMPYRSPVAIDHIMEPLEPSPRKHKLVTLLAILFMTLFVAALFIQKYVTNTLETDEAKRTLMLVRTTLSKHGDWHHILSKSSNPTLMKNVLNTLIPLQLLDTPGYFLAVIESDGTLVTSLPEGFDAKPFLTSKNLLETAHYTPMVVHSKRPIWGGQNAVLISKLLTPEGRTVVIGHAFHDGLIPWDKISRTDLIVPFGCAFLISGLVGGLVSLRLQKRTTQQAFSRLSNYMNVA